MTRKLLSILCITVLLQACVSSSKYKATVAHVESLKADSALLAKRNRMLTEDKSYLESKSANMEQSLNQRLQEKEDSLNQKGELLKQREASINDMKARKAEEREAFETLSKSVFELFNEYTPTEVHRYTNCTQINVEVPDRLLFIPGTAKIDPKLSKMLTSVAQALNKNADLNLIIVAHTDSLVSIKEKFDDNWTLGSLKANALVRALIREQKIAPSRVYSASRAETIALSKANSSLGKNRIAFVFYSSFLPCIHSKEE
jgi:flagellar motor protein MotB